MSVLLLLVPQAVSSVTMSTVKGKVQSFLGLIKHHNMNTHEVLDFFPHILNLGTGNNFNSPLYISIFLRALVLLHVCFPSVFVLRTIMGLMPQLKPLM
jgi:hypothetical protein